jgi:hypothetical protein
MHDKLQESVYNFRFYKTMPNLGVTLFRAQPTGFKKPWNIHWAPFSAS